ncbi:30S ribosomal protein S11 [Candidatus Uhrbacteria bacterium]|nr:30S ribosomal protein S11 [Candidatus Uhrbacteria bacterium]
MTEVNETQATATPEAKPAAKAKKASKGRKKSRVTKHVAHGRAYIHATFNNTIVTVTDQNGNTLAWASAGNCGFKGPKKATPYAASVVVRNLAEKLQDYGVKDVSVFATGVGQGREGAVRAFNSNNINVVSIKDTTPIPHNGCRKPRTRRM